MPQRGGRARRRRHAHPTARPHRRITDPLPHDPMEILASKVVVRQARCCVAEFHGSSNPRPMSLPPHQFTVWASSTSMVAAGRVPWLHDPHPRKRAPPRKHVVKRQVSSREQGGPRVHGWRSTLGARRSSCASVPVPDIRTLRV